MRPVPDPAVLDDLIGRLEAATGPDLDLSTDINLALRPNHDALVIGSPEHLARQGRRFGPHVLAATGAALDLVEHAMPGVFYLLAKGRTRADEPLYAFQLMFGTDEVLGDAEQIEPGLAICLALCRALRQEPRP